MEVTLILLLQKAASQSSARGVSSRSAIRAFSTTAAQQKISRSLGECLSPHISYSLLLIRLTRWLQLVLLYFRCATRTDSAANGLGMMRWNKCAIGPECWRASTWSTHRLVSGIVSSSTREWNFPILIQFFLCSFYGSFTLDGFGNNFGGLINSLWSRYLLFLEFWGWL